MTYAIVLGFVLLAGIDTSAHLLFKIAAADAAPAEPSAAWLARVLHTGWVYGAVACYVATFFLWISLLRRVPVGVAFAASHMDVVTVLAASAVLLREPISETQLIGAAMIVSGIACLASGRTGIDSVA